MKYLLIPSAKFAPDNLPNYGSIPMALYPVNGHTILHHIISNYSSDYQVVVCGFEGLDRLRHHLRHKKYKDVRLVELEGLTDLGGSIRAMLEAIQVTNEDQVTINFADTLIDSNALVGDVIFSISQFENDKKWTYFTQEEGVITSIVDKKEKPDEGTEYQLFVGVINLAHPKDFLDALEARSSIEKPSLFLALQDYSKAHHFEFTHADNWLDLGHPDDYFNSVLSVKAREFNHIAFDKNRGIITKTSKDIAKFNGEIRWFHEIPRQLSYVHPRIFDFDIGEAPFVEMEFYSYPTLLELSLYGDLPKKKWRTIFERILFVLNDFAEYRIKSKQIKPSLYAMYCTKTVERIEALRNNPSLASFFEGEIVVNGKKYRNLSDISKMIDGLVKDNLLNIEEFQVIHGDLCFGNILIDNNFNFIKLIDPRGKFGSFSVYGDSRYELAKLFHSVDGKYDFIIKDLFEVSREGNTINYTFYEKRGFSLYALMKSVFAPLIGKNLREIEIIESLLFFSMIALHGEDTNHQYAMLACALEILNRNVPIEVVE